MALPTLFAAEATGGATAPAPPGGPEAAVGWILAGVLIVGFVVAIVINVRRGRAEVGSEIELAPNRKPYLSDDELETTKLDRTLTAALALLAIISIAVPMYWLYEPARQAGAVKMFEETAIRQGEEIYTTTANCAECHGPEGVGGVKATPILNDNGQFVAQVNWQAPALNNVMYRYSREEVLDILNYGRGNTPMPAWGAPGGGPLTEQQLTDVIDYLTSIQVPAEETRKMVDEEIELVCKPSEDVLPNGDRECTVPDPASPDGALMYDTLGEALFNLGQYDGFAGGAFSCARCHTKGWSWGDPEVPGGGGLGPNLTGGSTLRQFDTDEAQIAFVSQGSQRGRPFGNLGNGSGQMPGFGVNPNAELEGSKLDASQVMYTQEQIAYIVAYERSL
jgi:mono/diheme cytochrome c family protein